MIIDETKLKRENYLFRIVYETCRYFGITPKKIPSTEMERFNEMVADLVMLNLLNIKEN